jgi:undecaprenyl diphosphate synthase
MVTMLKKNLPTHVAIIMDGNGRWAKKRNLPRFLGHKEGANSVRSITEACAGLGIKYLTLYAFSTENWKRSAAEVGFLMGLLDDYLGRELGTMMKNNVRFRAIGDIAGLPEKVREKIFQNEKKTARNTGLTLVLALNYGSKDELTRACRNIAALVKQGKLNPAKITQKTISESLYTKNMPDPDFLIRTSGEMRLSNFLLWQLAYAEFYVTKKLWPDFRKPDLLVALKAYAGRQRRFGGV